MNGDVGHVTLVAGFDEHPKFQNTSHPAIGLWAKGLGYASDHLTDGYLPERWVRRSCDGQPECIEELVDAGLWERVEDGYQVHDYCDYNPSREQIKNMARSLEAAERELDAMAEEQEERRRYEREKKRRQRSVPGTSPGDKVSPQTPLPFSSPKDESGFDVEVENQNGNVPEQLRDEWDQWLRHYRETTGRKARGSKPARQQFNARRRDGYSLADLQQATVGCHGDDFCRNNGHDIPETILRVSKVDRYISLADKPALPEGRRGKLTARLAELDQMAKDVE